MAGGSFEGILFLEHLLHFSAGELLEKKIPNPTVDHFLGVVTQSNPMMIVTEYLPKEHLSSSGYMYLRVLKMSMRLKTFAGWDLMLGEENDDDVKINVRDEVLI
ncbi:hypothetical protein Tco_1249299 [Tanacetum coccineum]